MLIVIFFYLIMCHRVFFREDIFEKYILCKKENNDIKYVINEYIKL